MAGLCALLLAAGVVMAVTMREDKPTSVSTGSPGETADSSTTTSPSTTEQEATTTTQPSTTATSSPTRHDPSGLVFTLSTSSTEFRSGDEVAFTLLVRNDSNQTRTYNSSPGPRFAFTSGDKQIWNDGCETAYAAIFATDEIAPGEEVTFTGSYPQTLNDPASRESCQQPPGDYNLTGLFQWCPTEGDDCEHVPITPVAVRIIA